jgi:hypothetical protein
MNHTAALSLYLALEQLPVSFAGSPHGEKKFRHSFLATARKIERILRHRPGIARSAALRRSALSSLATLWVATLSMMIRSPQSSVGAGHCLTR